MKALTFHGKRDVRIEEVPDPTIEEPGDAIIRITSSAICGSDLHLYEVLGPFIDKGAVLGHEPMGIVEEVGTEVTGIKPGDRVVVPFQIACGSCWMCNEGLPTQCETTQVREQGTGAALFGFSNLYGGKSGGQAELLRVPHASYTSIKVPEGPPDDRFLFLSDVLPTAWQGVEYAGVPDGGTLLILGLGPIGSMAARVALHRGHRVIGVDMVAARLARAEKSGAEVLNLLDHEDDLADVIREMTDGRGPDSVIDAVGMEAHGDTFGKLAQTLAGLLPDAVAAKVIEKGGVDRMGALHLAIDAVRRGGTISLSGVYGGMIDPMPLMTMFDKQIQLRMGQANVKRWVPEIMPLLTDEDPLGVDTFATHHVPLDQAPEMYDAFQKREDGVVKVVLKP